MKIKLDTVTTSLTHSDDEIEFTITDAENSSYRHKIAHIEITTAEGQYCKVSVKCSELRKLLEFISFYYD